MFGIDFTDVVLWAGLIVAVVLGILCLWLIWNA